MRTKMDIEELENNLINITTKDMIYRIKANELSRSSLMHSRTGLKVISLMRYST